MSYTPILIHYVPAVLTSDNNDPTIVTDPIRLVIEAPVTRLFSKEQGIPAKSTVVIPENGVLKLKLLPSRSYVPYGVYKVSVITGKNRIPSHVMNWIVPESPSPITLDVVHLDDQGDSVGMDFYELLSVQHSGTYRVFNDKIYWVSGAPALNSSYKVTLQPPVTLNDLIIDR